MNKRIDPEHLLTAVDEILSLVAACRHDEPLPQLIRHLDLITPSSDARAAARMTLRSLPTPNPPLEQSLTAWWLDKLVQDTACPSHIALYEILNALEIGRAPPSTRTQLHEALRSTLHRSLTPYHEPESATLLLLLPDMLKRPGLLPDTRLLAFNTVLHHSEALLEAHPNVTRQQIHLLAQAAHTSWKTKPTQTQHPSEALQIMTLAESNTEEAALRAHLLLQDTDTTPARLALLDQMSLHAASILSPRQALHFMTGLHRQILFMPELAQPSRSLLLEAFEATAQTPSERGALAETIRPHLFADGPLNAFLLQTIADGQAAASAPPPPAAPPAPPSLLARARNWMQRRFS